MVTGAALTQYSNQQPLSLINEIPGSTEPLYLHNSSRLDIDMSQTNPATYRQGQKY
jgi:hypothetical protein